MNKPFANKEWEGGGGECVREGAQDGERGRGRGREGEGGRGREREGERERDRGWGGEREGGGGAGREIGRERCGHVRANAPADIQSTRTQRKISHWQL
jgi:hypothetical protein